MFQYRHRREKVPAANRIHLPITFLGRRISAIASRHPTASTATAQAPSSRLGVKPNRVIYSHSSANYCDC